VGWNAAQGNGGASAVHIGGEAGQIAAGNYQVNIGYRAGKQGSATGTGNIAIGWQTGFANSFNNVIQIGASVVADKANQVIIGASGTSEFRSANYRLNVGQTLPSAAGFFLEYNSSSSQIELRQNMIRSTAAIDFTSTTSGNSTLWDITVTGAALGDIVTVEQDKAEPNMTYSAWVESTNTVRIKAHNISAATIDPASKSFKVIVFK
jgi:hypothetical protein